MAPYDTWECPHPIRSGDRTPGGKIRQHHKERALVYPSRQLIISLYADDLTLYIKNPHDNLNPVLREITKFGAISGIQINGSKSAVFLLTESTKPHQLDYPLAWNCDIDIWVFTSPGIKKN